MAKKAESTLRCVLTLAIIAVICGLLLSVLNPVLAVEPTAEDLEVNFEEGYSWNVLKLNKDCKTEGGKVNLVAEGTKEGKDTIIGLLVSTNADGKLGESTYAMFVNKQTNKLEKVTFVKEGATGGFTFDKYVSKKAHAGKGEVATGATALTGILSDPSAAGEGGEPMNLEDFCGVEITSDEAFSGYNPPAKTGATKTANAVYNSFNIMAKYYYENFVKGGQA